MTRNAARELIAKVRAGRHKHNPEIMELCRLLEGHVGGAVAKPDRKLYMQDRKLYMAHYMRWYRQYGQLKTRVDA
jgi:hypothetical protein